MSYDQPTPRHGERDQPSRGFAGASEVRLDGVVLLRALNRVAPESNDDERRIFAMVHHTMLSEQQSDYVNISRT